jgi:hypothetical protein
LVINEVWEFQDVAEEVEDRRETRDGRLGEAASGDCFSFSPSLLRIFRRLVKLRGSVEAKLAVDAEDDCWL